MGTTMTWFNHLSSPGRLGPLAGRLLGVALAVLPLAAVAETYVRLFPPKDLHPYLGEMSPLTGLYQPDEDFGVTYRSWETFRNDNAERLGAFGPFAATTDARRTWAF